MIAYIFKPKRIVAGKSKPGKFYSLRIGPDRKNLKTIKLGVRDKQVAEKRKQELAIEAEREAAGVGVSKKLRDASSKELTSHLDDFLADQRAKGRDTAYVYNAERLINRLLKECKWQYPAHVTSESFEQWRACTPENVKTGEPLSAKTLNEYLSHASKFLNWMLKRGCVIVNPLLVVGKVEQRGREVRKPRPMTEAEMTALLAVKSKWRTVYLIAALTGLRRDELRQLVWDDVHLDAVPMAFIKARAATTKNKKDAVLWLRDDGVSALRALKPAGVSGSARVFDRLPKMEAFRKDLRAAKIDTGADSSGKWVMFHSLRHTMNQAMAAGGVDPQIAMKVMRHSDLRLTMGAYLDRAALPTIDAVEHLPRWEQPALQVLAKTGTDDDAHRNAHTLVPVRQGASVRGTTENVENTGNSAGNPAICREIAPDGVPCPEASKSWGTRIRT